ncbi:MAG: apolipoprotein N-acyltransferase [Cytophagaceae bacterium]|nr:apolipoprotein N-acyltransferase [Cytophagaceae bacterium]
MNLNSKPYYLFLLSLLSGFLLWLAWPTKPFPYILFFAFVPLLIIEHSISSSAGKRRGWKFLGYSYLTLLTWNILTSYWIYNSTPAGGILAMTLNAVLMCLPMMLFFFTKRISNESLGLAAFVVYWITFEFIHLNWELTWPWLTLGNAFASLPQAVQWYEYTGALGGTLWILLSNVMVFLILREKNTLKEKVHLHKKKILFVLCWIFLPSIISLLMYATYEEKGEDIEVLVVQPNIDPYEEKFFGSERFIPYEEQLNRLITLSEDNLTPDTRYIAWPETALPYGYFEDDMNKYPVILRLKKFIADHPNVSLITGLDTYKLYQTKATPTCVKYREDEELYKEAFNSAMQINENQEIVIYHKSKLVPGVEHMPSFMSSFAIALGESAGGLGRQKYRTVFFNKDNIGVAPVICYESIFGEFVTEYVKKGANMIFIVTNDGWWGNTQGHKQHLQYAVLRAIETRKSIARSANTGISGFINQRGDILEQSRYWEQKAMRRKIKQNRVKTFYSLHGDYLGKISAFGAIAVFILAIIFVIRRKK